MSEPDFDLLAHKLLLVDKKLFDWFASKVRVGESGNASFSDGPNARSSRTCAKLGLDNCRANKLRLLNAVRRMRGLKELATAFSSDYI